MHIHLYIESQNHKFHCLTPFLVSCFSRALDYRIPPHLPPWPPKALKILREGNNDPSFVTVDVTVDVTVILYRTGTLVVLVTDLVCVDALATVLVTTIVAI